MKQRFIPRLIVSLLVVMLTSAGSIQSSAAAPIRLPIAPNWGACGLFTDENKVVRAYSKGFTLRCGGPKLNNDPRWGYRHIIRYHKDDFKRLVSPLLMQRNWRDLTDFVIEWMILEPENIKAAGGGKPAATEISGS